MGHTHRYQFGFKKKKKQVKSPSPESRVPETGSDPPIGANRDSGRDIHVLQIRLNLANKEMRITLNNYLSSNLID